MDDLNEERGAAPSDKSRGERRERDAKKTAAGAESGRFGASGAISDTPPPRREPGAKKPEDYVVSVIAGCGGRPEDYYWNNIELSVGDLCVVENGRDLSFGKVAVARLPASLTIRGERPGRIARRATGEDEKRARQLARKEKTAMAYCREKIVELDVPMSLSRVNYTFDGKKAVFFFTAEGRVDFRELVRELANFTRVKVEMRQIGVRDEARMMGGCGPCGHELCCSTFLPDFAPVSIRMAKDQNLSLNPSKISGVCGRLMCCLAYEHAHYKELTRRAPRLGKGCLTTDGRTGRVLQLNLLRERVTVMFEDESKKEYDLSEVVPRRPGQQVSPPPPKTKDSKEAQAPAEEDAAAAEKPPAPPARGEAKSESAAPARPSKRRRRKRKKSAPGKGAADAPADAESAGQTGPEAQAPGRTSRKSRRRGARKRRKGGEPGGES
ncbi:MAG: PSP1 domain-containing protein [Candidatus Nitrospinota bacterium M3_3B_026]